jgi:hypothetical protein
MIYDEKSSSGKAAGGATCGGAGRNDDAPSQPQLVRGNGNGASFKFVTNTALTPQLLTSLHPYTALFTMSEKTGLDKVNMLHTFQRNLA